MSLSVKNQNLQRSCGTSINKKRKNIYNTSNFIVWKILFFSIIPLARASVVDESYLSSQDVYDGILNALFPIFFVILFQIDNSTTTKKKLLPILDDILYNTVTWLIPLVVTFSYGELLGIKIFALVNMCLHVFCATIGIIKYKTIKDALETPDKLNNYYYISVSFLIFFPVIVIPIFWIAYIIKTHHVLDSISIVFIALFGFLLFLGLFTFCFLFCLAMFDRDMSDNFFSYCFFIGLYGPNILQTLLIMLKWPINFYFVKLWLFILILSLTRNISYFTDEVPKDFLATSTTFVQYIIATPFKPDTPSSDNNSNEPPSINEVFDKFKEIELLISKMKKEDDDAKNNLVP